MEATFDEHAGAPFLNIVELFQRADSTGLYRRCNRQHAHDHRVAHCFNEPGFFLDRLLQRLRLLSARVVHQAC